MHTKAKMVNAQRSLDGDLIISFQLPDMELEEITKYKDKDLTLDIARFYEKRSLNANKYFWKLCTLIAQEIGSDKDTVYRMQLRKYGYFIDTEIPEYQADSLKAKFRHTEEYADRFGGMAYVRCYIGSSHYDKAEMGRLIEGTHQDCHDLRISTWDDEEVKMLLDRWEAQ